MKIDDLQSIVEFIFKYIPSAAVLDEKLQNAKLIAHRGWHEKDVLENTLASFDLARKYGIYGIEFDIRWTSDYVPVVHHDRNTKRVFGEDEDVFSLTFTELRSRFPLIPTLEEVVLEYSNYLVLFIELKFDERYDMERCQVELQRLLYHHIPIQHYHFITLSIDCLKMIETFTNSCKFLIAKTNTKKISEICLDHDLAGFLGHFVLTTDNLVAKHHSSGQLIGTGQINNLNTLKRELNRDIDFIFTNKPWEIIAN